MVDYKKPGDDKVVSINRGDKLPPALPIADNPYFAIMGYQNSMEGPVFWVYNKKSRGVHGHRSGGIRKESVAAMCPSGYLQQIFPEADSHSKRVDALREAIISCAFKAGHFSPDRMRGLGAWVEDDGRHVLHAGDRLIVDGDAVELEAMRGGYVYELREPLAVALDRPLTADEGRMYHDTLDRLSWEREESSWLLAGWVFCAKVCGALPWRPHAWLSGPSGTGKSWVLEHLVMPALRPMALHVSFASTEAGVRQRLQRDALPVVFDEAEAETEHAAARVQNVLGLMRQSSANTGGQILKGTSGSEGAQAYDIRSMFLCASIMSSVVQTSDEGRVTPLVLGKARGAEAFEAIRAQARECMGGDFGARMLARAVRLLPQLLGAVEVFTAVCEGPVGSRRMADQVGVLLAGAWVLRNDGVPTYDEASAVVGMFSWQAEKVANEEPDEIKCFRAITEWVVQVPTQRGPMRASIAELALVAAQATPHPDLSPTEAQGALQHHGMRVLGDQYLAIQTRHQALAKHLTRTPFHTRWDSVLVHMPGAYRPTTPQRFGSQMRARCVCIPLLVLTQGEDEPA